MGSGVVRGPGARSVAALLCLALLPTSGCSLFILAGKVMSGGKAPAPFRTVSGVDLTAGEREVLILTSVGTITPSDAAFEVDLRDAVARKLRGAGVKVVTSSVVDDLALGGYGERIDAKEVFDASEADVVIDVRLETVTFREEQSPDLFLGKLTGEVTAYGREDGKLFDSGISATHPASGPEAFTASSEATLRSRFVELASRRVAELFYDHAVDFEVF